MDSWSDPSMMPWYSIKDEIVKIVVYKEEQMTIKYLIEIGN